MYGAYAGMRPAAQAYLFAFILSSTGNDPHSFDPTAELDIVEKFDPQVREDQIKGYEITLEAITYGKMSVGLKGRSRKVLEILQVMAQPTSRSFIRQTHIDSYLPFRPSQKSHQVRLPCTRVSWNLSNICSYM